MKIPSLWFQLAFCAASLNAQVSATIDIDSTTTTPLNANFGGFNDEVTFPVEYYDYRMNNLAAQLSPGWVRYPSGSFSAAFNWQTGLMVPAWVTQFQGTTIGPLLAEGLPWADGKGGGSFVDGANRADFLGAKLIIDVTAFTDTPQSIGQMAAFAKANHIPVAVWELANEPYTVTQFFPTGADYVAKVKPFRDAIKAADPDATVAIFFLGPSTGNPNPPWNQSILSYPNPYWDAVVYHHYPGQSTGAFSQWMADENAELASKTTAYVNGYLAPLNPPGTKFLITEFLPSNDGMGTGTSLTDGTLYGAIYAAEYVMRMSSLPSMLYVGMQALTGTRGVNAVNNHYPDVQNAYNQGATINTLTLPFGFFYTAQPLGVAILYGVLRNAAQVDSTTVTGGASVPATGLGQIPALYAQAYTSATGLQSVVITNKGATVHQVTINVNGTPVSGPLAMQLIAGSDPTVVNTASNQNAVSVQSVIPASRLASVTVPAYSVVRVDLNSPAVATVVNSASYTAGPVSPQEIVSLFGPGIAAQTGTTSFQITDSTGSSQLATVVFSVASGQANILMPSGLAAGPATVTVLHGSAPALTASITVANSAPGLYSANSDGAGVAAANAVTVSASEETLRTVSTCNPPALRSCLPAPLSIVPTFGTFYIELFGTGIRGASSVQCFVAGQSVPVLFAGGTSSFGGLDQVNISIPQTLAGTGDVRVYLVADGVASNVVVLNFQ